MSVNPSPIGGFAAQFFDNNGQPLSGGKIYTYAAGTTTPQATYTSALGVTPHANPIVLDSAGRVPGGEIWLTDSLVYKFVIETATAVLIGTYDNITGVNSNFVNYTIQEEVITATAGQTVFNLTTINYTPATNSLSVYIDGVNQYVGDSYLETDSNTVTFTAGLHVGAEVKFTTAVQTSTGASNANVIAYDPPFTGGVATTVEDKLAQYISVKDFGAVGDGVTDDTAAFNAFYAASNSMKLIPAGSYLVSSVVRTYGTDVLADNVQLFPAGIAGTENRAVENSFFEAKAAVRAGGSDTTPLNDERNFWRGLPSQNAWGNLSDIGVFSVAFNRNGASYGSYSTTFGHDCVTYGVASIAMGAGSCTGDPDDPTSPAFQGYCATAFGKNVLALGEKSAAFCEETQSLSRASFTAGYASIAGEYSGSGLGPIALGDRAQAYGDGAFAAGKYVRSTAGNFTIGSGINPGSPFINTRPNCVAFGTNTVYAPFFINPGTGTVSLQDAGYAEFSVSPVYFTDYLGGTTLFTCGYIRPIITNSGGNGYGGVQLEANINGTITSICRADSDTNIPSLLPTADDSRRLGSAALRWSVVFAATGAINTSDVNEKQQIRNLTAKEVAVAKKLKSLVRAFKFNDAVAEKGDKARTHIGVIAQDVKAAFEAEGLCAEKYAILCWDEWGDVYDNDGNLTREKGGRYGVRYEELLAFIVAAI